MKNKIIITIAAITLLSSCTHWNSEDNPVENGVKKFGGLIDNVKNKVGDKTKYSVLSQNRERNKELYYKENLNKLLASNYQTIDGSNDNNIYVIEEDITKSGDKSKTFKKIYQSLSNFCVNNTKNYPKFHKRKGINNVFNQVMSYSLKDRRILEHKLQSEDIGNYVGEFACFKKYIGDIWTVSIGVDIEKIGKRNMSFINIISVESVKKRERDKKHYFWWNNPNNPRSSNYDK